jgi:coproporphyrinogen III oxidase-like Fe-S oxidoreductase
MRLLNNRYLGIGPIDARRLPEPHPDQQYMLYAHVPFCERLCPYCSFNRYPFNEQRAHQYYEDLRSEMRMLKGLEYDFASLYIGGGTPTILIDELAQTIDLARDLFNIEEVSCETNPNHLVTSKLETLRGRVQRLSVGVQSFDDDLLRQMERYNKYGSGMDILGRLVQVAEADIFDTLNADMIFNFPSQTEDALIYDLACILESGASQTTFYPLMASPSVELELARTVGRVDYSREAYYYALISEALAGGSNPVYKHGSAWTFNATSNAMIDEYIVDYEEYPAIGSGGFSYLKGQLFVNTFSLRDYHNKIAANNMSVSATKRFTLVDQMRYRLMMQLFGLRLDKQQWYDSFGVSVAAGLPVEYAFLKGAGALIETNEAITLTPKGRYLMVALMRQFFIGVNGVRDKARAALSSDERQLLFGE